MRRVLQRASLLKHILFTFLLLLPQASHAKFSISKIGRTCADFLADQINVRRERADGIVIAYNSPRVTTSAGEYLALNTIDAFSEFGQANTFVGKYIKLWRAIDRASYWDDSFGVSHSVQYLRRIHGKVVRYHGSDDARAVLIELDS